MSGREGTLERIALLLGQALKPLAKALSGDVSILFSRLGIAPSPGLFASGSMPAALAAAASAVTDLATAVDALNISIEGDDSSGISLHGVASINKIATLIQSLATVGTGLVNAAQNDASLTAAQRLRIHNIALDLPKRLLALMVIDDLLTQNSALAAGLNLMGLLDISTEPGDPADPMLPSHVEKAIRLDRLAALITRPLQHFQSLLGFGLPTFDGLILFGRLKTILDNRFELTTIVTEVGKLNVLQAPTFVLAVDHTMSPPGLVYPLRYGVSGATDVEFVIGGWDLKLRQSGQFAANSALKLAPSSGQVSIVPPSGQATLTFSIDFGADRKEKPFVLFGTAGGTAVSVESVELHASLTAKWDAASGRAGAEPRFGAELKGGRVRISTEGADGFIAKILGGFELESNFDLGLDFSLGGGLHFRGGSALAIQLASHVSLGPVTVNALTLSIGIKDDAFPIAVTADFQTSLGPLTAVIKGLGFRIDVKLASDDKGNLGPIDIQPAFQAPNGVGLEVNAGGFTGGGFLRLDPDKGEYEGGLELNFLGTISVRAIGVLSTRMPDGSEGFSLVIIIVSEFPPLQLSYGFTLVGVGGLLGLNRTVLLEQLQSGVHDGSLNSILFPTDIVANSARIISDLKRVFPPRDGRFLVGPMAKLGWGTPTLISLSLAIILEIPQPMFTIIGVLHMALPADELPLLHLQGSFGGGVDFESGELWFDGSLFDSRMGTFTLTGDMAVRAHWKENANFLLTVGGFHPAYTPPPMNLPELARLGMVLFQGNPHVSAQVYFAVTSNSVQLGARVEVYYGIDLFNVYGFLGLDVLINFNPFHFVAEITAEIGVRTGDTVLFAIQLQLLLEGPTPWHARGTGSFRIGFIIKVTVSAGFDVTFGDARETRLPPVDVLAEMVKALSNLGNWRPRLPSGSNQHVTLRELPDPTKTLVLHPFGALEITQKLVPLHVAIQRFGSRAPAAGSVFTLADVKLGAEDAGVSNTREQFAPAQFFNLSDAEKLSRPSFADYDAGIVIDGDLAPRTDLMRTREVVYEVIYLPEHHPVRVTFGLASELAGYIVLGSAVAQSPVSHNQRAVSVLEERASLNPERYAVVSTNDLSLHAAHLVFDNATAADQAVQSLISEQPELFGAIQVLPAAAMAGRSV